MLANEETWTDASSSSVDRLNATVHIDQQGAIRALNTSVTRSHENEILTTGLNYSVRMTGDETPTRPEWVTTELPHLNASVSGNGTVIALEHTGGMSVSNASLVVYSPTVAASAELLGTFEPGDTLYIYQTQNATDRVTIHRNERPEVNDSFIPLGGENLSLTVDRSAADTFNSGMMIRLDVQNDSATRTPNLSMGTPDGE